MALFVSGTHVGVNMDVFLEGPLPGGITFAVSDRIYADDAFGDRDALFGNFSYAPFGDVTGRVTGGTVNHIQETLGGFLHFDVSGFTMSATAFLSDIHGGALATILSGSDSIGGSSFNDTLRGFAGADTI